MTTAWHKVIRDFWQERTRSLLVVLAIALGIAGFSSVFSAYAILTRELNNGYLASNPASASLGTDVVDEKLLRAVRAVPGVGDVEARRSVRGRVQAEHGEWRRLRLFIVKDYGDIRIHTLKPQEGAWPPGPGEILIERDAFQVARTKIGETVTVKTADGKERALRVTGCVHDVGQAQARMEQTVYGYVSLDTLAQLGEKPFLDTLYLEVAENKFDQAHIRAVAQNVKERVASLGHAVRWLDVPKPGAHPHADIMGLLLLMMAAFGLFTLLLSGILVVNLLTALMASQVRQIGVMKAVGGTRWQIARVYFAQALLLGSAALLIGIPAGMWGSRVLALYMAGFLNFDVTSFAVPVWVYATEAAAGLVVPVLAAAYPVIKGSAVTVREALADVGVARQAFGTSALDRALAGVGGVTRPVLLAVRNSFRRRVRLGLTLVTLSLAGVFFLSALNIRSSIMQTLDHVFGRMKYDLEVSLEEMHPLEEVGPAVRRTPGVIRVDGWTTSQATLVDRDEAAGSIGKNAPESLSFSVIALPPETDLFTPEIAEGRWLRSDDTNALLVNLQLAQKDSRFQVGRDVTLRMGSLARSWRLVGTVRKPFPRENVAYVSKAFMEKLSGHAGMTNDLRVVLEPASTSSISQAKIAVERSLEEIHVRARSVGTGESRLGLDMHMVMLYVFLIIMACVLAGVGGLGLITTMSLNVLERRREMGVLRAIGASRATVFLIVLLEAGVIGLLSWALGTLAAWPISRSVANYLMIRMAQTDLDFAFDGRGIAIWLVVCVLLAAAASLLPAWQASRRPIREAIGYE